MTSNFFHHAWIPVAPGTPIQLAAGSPSSENNKENKTRSNAPTNECNSGNFLRRLASRPLSPRNTSLNNVTLIPMFDDDSDSGVSGISDSPRVLLAKKRVRDIEMRLAARYGDPHSPENIIRKATVAGSAENINTAMVDLELLLSSLDDDRTRDLCRSLFIDNQKLRMKLTDLESSTPSARIMKRNVPLLVETSCQKCAAAKNCKPAHKQSDEKECDGNFGSWYRKHFINCTSVAAAVAGGTTLASSGDFTEVVDRSARRESIDSLLDISIDSARAHMYDASAEEQNIEDSSVDIDQSGEDYSELLGGMRVVRPEILPSLTSPDDSCLSGMSKTKAGGNSSPPNRLLRSPHRSSQGNRNWRSGGRRRSSLRQQVRVTDEAHAHAHVHGPEDREDRSPTADEEMGEWMRECQREKAEMQEQIQKLQHSVHEKDKELQQAEEQQWDQEIALVQARKQATQAREKFSAFLKEQNEINFKQSMPSKATIETDFAAKRVMQDDDDTESENEEDMRAIAIVQNRIGKAETHIPQQQSEIAELPLLSNARAPTFGWAKTQISKIMGAYDDIL